jgi:uncharacterized protein (TIRG00374 family)
MALSLLGLLASIVAIVVLLASLDLGLTLRIIARAQPALIVGTLPLIAIGITLRSLRWQRLLPGRGASVPVHRIAPQVLIGYLGNAVLPARMGELVRAYLLARREGLSSAAVFGSALLERIVDLTVLTALALAAAIAIGAPSWAIQLLAIAALAGTVVIGLLATVGLGPLVGFLRRVFGRLGRHTNDGLIGLVERFSSGIGGESRRVPLIQAAAISVVIWLIDGLICWLVARSVAIDISPASAVLVVGVGALGTSIPSAPGYVGTYELAVSTIARALGVSAAPALGFALVLHAATLLPVALAGLISLWLVGNADLLDIARTASVEREATE